MNKIYIVPIEPIDQRYTKQWYQNIPLILQEATDKFEIETVGYDSSLDKKTTPGAFLDFAFTNSYKAWQVQRISSFFERDYVKAGDRFLFTDAWNFAVPAIRYMSELLDIPVELHGIWHAGSYDPTDILGMNLDINWSYDFEKALFNALDFNYFATDFHKDMFLETLGIDECDHNRAIRSGQPHTPIIKPLLEKSVNEKYDFAIFPHRLNSDKQPEIAADLNQDVTVLVTQGLGLTKDEYYTKLSHAKVIFSCALHENLGISVMEGCLAGAIPIVPDRASYSEMYLDIFKYPSEWTSSWETYQTYRPQLVNFLHEMIGNYDKYQDVLAEQQKILIDKYLTPTVMVNNLVR